MISTPITIKWEPRVILKKKNIIIHNLVQIDNTCIVQLMKIPNRYKEWGDVEKLNDRS